MNLDRSLIKSQAKQLIKGNVFKLFVVVFVVTLLTGGSTIYSSTSSAINQIPDSFDSSSSGENYGLNDADEYDFDDFGQDGNIENFDDFAGEIIGQAERESARSGNIITRVTSGISGFSGIIGLFLAPLAITLMGVFYQLIKGKNLSWNEEFEYVFSKTFDKNYWNKFLLNLLQSIFTALWMLLFIIPGIVYIYKVYFTSFILNEKPELSWKEAIEISKKMTDGHKGELFVLDLSFIGWDLLTIITFGLVGIYVTPYRYTTKALYYENFKLRAFQLGQLSEYDFLTENEKMAMASNGAQQPQGNFYQPQQENVYQPPVQDYTYQKAENVTDTTAAFEVPAAPVAPEAPATPEVEVAEAPEAPEAEVAEAPEVPENPTPWEE